MRYRQIVVRRRPIGGEQLDDDAIERLERRYPPTDFAFGSDGTLFSVKPGYRERMDPAGLPALLDAIRHMHGCAASWDASVDVHHTCRAETVWQGVVQVFAIEHPQARLVYAWSELIGDGPGRRFHAILGTGPVVDAVAAVREAIAAG